jgi:GTP:adenosylcobinamide-phosphate guanylyltransferase
MTNSPTARPNGPNAESPRVPAFVMAGGKTGKEFAAAAGVSDTPGSRALADINGLPMIRYVLRALRAAETIDRVLLVAPGSFPDQPEATDRVVAEGGLEENIRAAGRLVADRPFFLVVTADLPFLTPEAVDDYVRRSVALDVDCCYTGISREACEKRFPGVRRTFIRLREGSFTGGNLVFQRHATYEKQATLLKEAYRRRKSPLFLARLIGLGNALKFITGRLTLPDIEAAASRLLDVRCRIVISPYAEVGTDVDKADDLALARRELRPEG